MPKCKNCGRDYWISSSSNCAECEEKLEQERLTRLSENIILTTSIDVPNREVEEVISIVASEAAVGLNIFKDVANNWRDFIGGRSQTSQTALKDTREACLEGLKQEAARKGADAVIAVDFTYNQLSTSGPGGILFVAATGTAVKLRH